MWEKEVPKAKKTFIPIIFLVWGLIVFVVFGVILGFYQMFVPKHAGYGNVMNYAYVTQWNDDIYFVNPGDERLMQLHGTQAEAVTDYGVIYLTVIEDALYYVSTETGYLMQYSELGEDRVVLDYGCNNPIYRNGTLYFYSGMESLVYTVTVTDGIFSDPICLNEEIQVVSFTVDDAYMYYIPATGTGMWQVALSGEGEARQLSDAFCGQPMVVDGDVYFLKMGDDAGICVIRKDGTEESLVNVSANCLNISGSSLYYTDVSEAAGGAIYSVSMHGRKKPEQVTKELGADLQIVSGYVYYRTISSDGGMIWKRIPAGKTDEKGTVAESLYTN